MATRGDAGDAAAAAWEARLADVDAPLYTVGVVAELLDVDAQVVRGFDQPGLVEPARLASGHRRYSRRDIARLARALDLADEGIPKPGIERILALEERLAEREATRAGEGVAAPASAPAGPEASARRAPRG